MFISKKHLSRRTVLKGVGATLALPLLDAMTPAFAQSSTPRTLRFGTIYVPHGVIMDVWMPKKTGTDFELPIILKPLAGLREHFNVVTGLYSEGANAHSACPGFFSASAHAPRGNIVELNTSIDQVIAQKIGQGTTFPSMELAIEDSSNIFGTCAADFLCTYMDTISWRTPTQPLPMELNPRVVFERMFGGDGTSAEARRARLEQTTSILDAIAEDVHGLSGKLAGRDRERLDEYLANVREVERRIVQAEDQRSERQLGSAADAERYSRVVRGARQPDVRAPGARVPGRPHARHVVHDGPRAVGPVVSADRHRRRPSPDLAQQLRHEADGEEGEGRHLQPEPVRQASCSA